MQIDADRAGYPVPEQWPGPDGAERQVYCGDEYDPARPETYLALLFRPWDKMDPACLAEVLASLGSTRREAA